MHQVNKTTRFLRVSLVLVLGISVALFGFLGLYMSRESKNTIREIGRIYMSGLSEQINLHFRTTVELRMTQLHDMDLTANEDGNLSVGDLAELARARDFEHLGLLSADGELETFYGGPLEISNVKLFLDCLKRGENKVVVGINQEGEREVVLGIPAEHPMENGSTSVALVASLPTSYFTSTLALDVDTSMVYSFIIQKDGAFVLRTSDAFRENYFERVQTRYENDLEEKEQYIEDLKVAMEKGEDLSSECILDGETRQVYCTPLAYSEWYLLTFMPYTSLDEVINTFLTRWMFLILGVSVAAMGVLLFVFVRYFQMNKLQLQELEQSRQEAEEARKTAEQAQQEAEQASKAKSEFLSNMSHDIRTPMNAIVGMTTIATANINNKDQVYNCLKKIALSSKHLLGLINDVLDMSKIESGKMTLSCEQVSLREVMNSIVSIVQPQVKAKRQSFDVSIHDISTENVYCDSVRLNQVLLNLLSNAIKFTPDGGTIHIALYEEQSPKGEEYVRIHIQVKDSGIGMSPEFMAHMFDAFSREDSRRVRRTEGTGLGMAITKYIVDAMEGTIEVNSVQGEGTEFRITLDMEKAEAQEADMVLPPWNMLVVDDDAQLCKSAVDSLKSIGIHADWTHDGEDAIRRVVERAGRPDNYQIILLDWKLPGIDGLETARRIRQSLGSNVPILLISAYDWSEIEADAREAGINGFISKPLFKSTLYHGLKPFLDPGEEEDTTQLKKSSDLSGRRVLLAEDNELNWEIANELLSELGLELDWAETGQVCVDKFLASEPGTYNAVLMDLRMPVMDGYEATRRIRTSGRPDAELPIIAMTADAFAEDAKHCLEAGMNAHVAKPIDVQEVARLLSKYIAK